MTRHELINPESLGAPKGYSHGVLAKPGRLLFVAGRWAGTSTAARLHRLAAQFGRRSERVDVVREAGGEPENIGRLHHLRHDKQRYRSDRSGGRRLRSRWASTSRRWRWSRWRGSSSPAPSWKSKPPQCSILRQEEPDDRRSQVLPLESPDGVATITLDRPDRINALTFEVYAELRDTFVALTTERTFAPSSSAARAARLLLGRRRRRHHRRAVLSRMRGLTRVHPHDRRRHPQHAPPPEAIVAALHNMAAGAGAVIALACDVRIGAPDTRNRVPVPEGGPAGADMGAAYLLPRVVGLAQPASCSDAGR